MSPRQQKTDRRQNLICRSSIHRAAQLTRSVTLDLDLGFEAQGPPVVCLMCLRGLNSFQTRSNNGRDGATGDCCSWVGAVGAIATEIDRSVCCELAPSASAVTGARAGSLHYYL